MNLNLHTLPEALILEICDYLVNDIFALIAVSEVNTTLRRLAKSSKAFWLSAAARSELFIPLPTHKPLYSFTAEELYLASHRAVSIELNVTSPHPRLHSWRHITWPYEPSPGVELLTESANEENAEEAIHMHLAHPNGDWMFIVSSQNVLRILHLRSGRLALAYDGEYFDHGRGVPPRVAWAVEFKEEDEANLVMNCQTWLEKEKIWLPSIRLFHIYFDAERCLATMQYVGFRLMSTMPSHLDIAGGYIVAVENSSGPYDAGDVLLIRWADMEPLHLPPLHPSVRIAAFQEYLISVGVCSNNRIHLEVVGYPASSTIPSCTPQTKVESTYNRRLFKNKTESSNLAIHSYAIPFSGNTIQSGLPFSSFICHFYTGEGSSSIKLWIRPGRSGSWSVFPVSLDLADLRSSAMRFTTKRAYEGEALRKKFAVRSEDEKVIMEEKYLTHWAAPVASGRRFIWWRPAQLLPILPVGGWEGRNPNEHFCLFLSVIEDLAGVEGSDTNESELLDCTKSYDENSAAAKQLRAARRLQIPGDLVRSTASVYMFVMEEWSGTILVQMYAGDLWVLRYGKV